jgi:hypothetical protein
MMKFQGTPPRPLRHLSADALIATLRNRFERIADGRHQRSTRYKLADVLMAAFAMFSLKEPSLLLFQARKDEPAIKKLYRLAEVPCDTTMREILDGISIEHLNQAFADVVYELQRGGVLRRFVFDDGYYLMAIDGTEHFCSDRVHCDQCLERQVGKSKVQYYHQAVVATIVHPDHKTVFTLAVEPIVKQDGESKNDCERNAVSRLLLRIRELYPRLKLLVVEDALSSNAPHIADLKAAKMRFLLGAKPGDHAHLFAQVVQASDEGRDRNVFVHDVQRPDLLRSQTQYVEDLELNASHRETRVHFLQHIEFSSKDPDKETTFTWVTDHRLDRSLFLKYVRGGRARWRIENETFNTLKNQGYHYEHNYGHGKLNLATVLMLIMFLAFLVDQVQQACCPLFQAALKLCGTRRLLWDWLRCHVMCYEFSSFTQLWTTILTGTGRGRPPPVTV